MSRGHRKKAKSDLYISPRARKSVTICIYIPPCCEEYMNFIRNFLLDRRVGVERTSIWEYTDAYETPPEWYLKLGSLVPVPQRKMVGASHNEARSIDGLFFLTTFASTAAAIVLWQFTSDTRATRLRSVSFTKGTSIYHSIITAVNFTVRF